MEKTCSKPPSSLTWFHYVLFLFRFVASKSNCFSNRKNSNKSSNSLTPPLSNSPSPRRFFLRFSYHQLLLSTGSFHQIPGTKCASLGPLRWSEVCFLRLEIETGETLRNIPISRAISLSQLAILPMFQI